ncbi:MAG: MATE family efflux transporter [Ruminococcaceae bacterium]|nr:MATE family efflux transporter [Oscillospiraceae bacterium]
MTTDLTKGPALKQIFFFSVPFLIGNLFQQFYNVADMVIVGRTLDASAYAAVGATGSLVWFASGAIQSLTTGFSTIAARHFGAQDEEGVKKAFALSIKLSALISVAVSLLCALFARQILELLRTPDDIIDRSYRYIVWIFAGLVATALFNLLSNMIRALGDSRTPLYFLVIACVVNIILDYVFIAVLHMDTDGAGLATVLAQLISGLMCIVYIMKKQPRLHVRLCHFRRDKELTASLLQVGLPMAFLNMVLSVGAIFMQFVTNGLGTLYVAAQTTGTKIENFVTQPILSFGSSVAVFAAQNYGAKKYDRVVEGGRKTVLICLAWCVIAFLIMLPCGKYFVSWLAGDVTQQMVDNAYLYMIIGTALSFILSPLVIYKSILQSVGRTFWTMASGFTEIVARASVSLAVLALIERSAVSEASGFFMMCFASPAAWLVGLLTIWLDYILLARRFRRLGREQREECKNGEKGESI